MVGGFGFARRVWIQMSEDGLLTWAAALAYSWLFAVFPFLIFLMTLLPYLPERVKQTADKEIPEAISVMLPREAADTIWGNLQDNILNQPKSGPAFRVMGLVVALWAAAGGMSMTMGALDRCYELPVIGGRPFWKHRLLALGMTIVVAVLILAVVLLLPIGTIVKNWLVSNGYIAEASPLLLAFNVVRWALALLFMVSVLMVLYHFGPSVKHRFRWITPGAVFSIVVWIVLGLVFRVYVERFGNYNKTYGAIAGVAILLMVFYIDAVVLLIGAEINSEIDFEVLKIKRGTRDFRPAEIEEELADEDPATAAAKAAATSPPPAVPEDVPEEAPEDDSERPPGDQALGGPGH